MRRGGGDCWRGCGDMAKKAKKACARSLELKATDQLRHRRADYLGDYLATTLKQASFYPVWMRWTFALELAMYIERVELFDVYGPVSPMR